MWKICEMPESAEGREAWADVSGKSCREKWWCESERGWGLWKVHVERQEWDGWKIDGRWCCGEDARRTIARTQLFKDAKVPHACTSLIFLTLVPLYQQNGKIKCLVWTQKYQSKGYCGYVNYLIFGNWVSFVHPTSPLIFCFGSVLVCWCE